MIWQSIILNESINCQTTITNKRLEKKQGISLSSSSAHKSIFCQIITLSIKMHEIEATVMERCDMNLQGKSNLYIFHCQT